MGFEEWQHILAHYNCGDFHELRWVLMINNKCLLQLWWFSWFEVEVEEQSQILHALVVVFLVNCQFWVWRTKSIRASWSWKLTVILNIGYISFINCGMGRITALAYQFSFYWNVGKRNYLRVQAVCGFLLKSGHHKRYRSGNPPYIMPQMVSSAM